MISVVTVVEGEGCALVPGEPANAAVVQVAAANSAGSVRWDIMTSADATRRPIAARRCAFGCAAFGAWHRHGPAMHRPACTSQKGLPGGQSAGTRHSLQRARPGL